MLEYYERRLCYEVLSIIQENAIYIGMNAKDESSEEVFNALEFLRHHHWRTILFWKVVLESHYGMPRFLSFMIGDKKALFYYLLFFLEKQK
jgi:hypothetical protein